MSFIGGLIAALVSDLPLRNPPLIPLPTESPPKHRKRATAASPPPIDINKFWEAVENGVRNSNAELGKSLFKEFDKARVAMVEALKLFDTINKSLVRHQRISHTRLAKLANVNKSRVTRWKQGEDVRGPQRQFLEVVRITLVEVTKTWPAHKDAANKLASEIKDLLDQDPA